MASNDGKVTPMYSVTRLDGQKVQWAFVIEDTDPLAVPALLAYADLADGAGYTALSSQLRQIATGLPFAPPARLRPDADDEEERSAA